MKSKIQTICCIGAGFVGGPTMAVLANKCKDIQVYVVDLNKERISSWNDDDLSKLPIYEPGLSDIIKESRGVNLHFTHEVEKYISLADMIFISVNTPTKKKGIGAGKASDLKWIEASSRQIAKYSTGKTIVVEKSTLPVKTAQTIKKILFSYQKSYKEAEEKKQFYILSNPEFLAEGTAINDLENPDRILIGGEDSEAVSMLENIYSKWVDKSKILKMNLWSSELSKLTANAFLAQRISSINSISALCEATGADINEVAEAVGMDHRIGSGFLKAGPGFGGSCFKKDILNMIYICNYYGLNKVAEYWQKVIDINSWQQNRITKIIVQNLFGTLHGKKLGILGFSFKANTNDTRESPAISICKDLLEEGAKLYIYDPKVRPHQIETELSPNNENNNYKEPGSWQMTDSIQSAAKDSDALIILTEWDEFINLNWESLSSVMRKPSWVFDTRGVSNLNSAAQFDINTWRIGKSI